MSLPAPVRIIHTNSASDGSPIIRNDTVELERHGNMAHMPAFVQPQLVGRPTKVLEGGDLKADSPMSWICSTGVVCAWTGEMSTAGSEVDRVDLDPGFGVEGSSKHFFYVGATGQLTVIFKDDTRKVLNPGDVFVNGAGIFRYENNGADPVRLVVFSTPSDTVKVDGKELQELTGVRCYF